MASEQPDLGALRTLVGNCTHCGDCLESCPTYVISGLEGESPRGRISVLEHALDNPGLDPHTLTTRIDSCTGCLRCVAACPEDVHYDQLLPLARALADRNRPDGSSPRSAHRLAIDSLSHPWTLKQLLPVIRGAQKLGPKRFPEPVGTLAELVQTPPRRGAGQPIPNYTPATGAARGRVGLLLGCSQRVTHPQIQRATVAVLAAEGFDVVAPTQPDCCGALHAYRGDTDAAAARAQRTIDAFHAIGGVDQILTTAGGCGAAMQLYGEQLQTAQARAFSALVRDAAAFLADHEARARRAPLALTVAWHGSCQPAAQANGADPGRLLLEQIPQLQVRHTTDPGLCCGAIGSYRIDQPARARTLGARRAAQLTDTGADAIVSSSPDCADQITRSAALQGHELAVYHPLELLARSISG